MAGGYPCCCNGGCSVCDTPGTTPTLQATISGISQTNTPAIAQPCYTGNCSDLNLTVPLLGGGGIVWTPNDAGLAAALVIKEGTSVCSWSYVEQLCVFLGTLVEYEVRIMLYVKDTGGVGVYAGYRLWQVATGTETDRWYETLGTIAGTGDEIDCTAISESLDLTTVSGHAVVWCSGSPINLLLENAP